MNDCYEDHIDEPTEQAINALVSFNDDMRQIAMNAYQTKDLMNYVHEENDTLLQWIEAAEEGIIREEEQL